MPDLTELLSRIEKAEGPDAHLLIEAGVKVYPKAYPGAWVEDDEVAEWRFLKFEKFIGAGAWESAALALVERALPGVWYVIGKGKTRPDEPVYGAQLLFGDADVLGEGEHEHSLALAVLAALLKALIAEVVA